MRFRRCAMWVGAVCVVQATYWPVAICENIDPNNDDTQYAWAENIGWLNAEPLGNGGAGVQVGDDELSGWIWSENAGWISLSCENTLSCLTVDYGVTNDGEGNLEGFAWGENVGWLSFSCENTLSCGTASFGVTIDPATGDFNGYAWGENVGWLSLSCENTLSCGIVNYRVKSGWVCAPPPAVPTDVPVLELAESEAGTLLLWDLVAGVTGNDIVRGNLGVLITTAGDFGQATTDCLDNHRTTTSLVDADDDPPSGEGVWYLVRGQNCGGDGTYDSGGLFQVGQRDDEIAASTANCQ